METRIRKALGVYAPNMTLKRDAAKAAAPLSLVGTAHHFFNISLENLCLPNPPRPEM